MRENMMVEKGKLLRDKKPTDYCTFKHIYLDLFKDRFGCCILRFMVWELERPGFMLWIFGSVKFSLCWFAWFLTILSGTAKRWIWREWPLQALPHQFCSVHAAGATLVCFTLTSDNTARQTEALCFPRCENCSQTFWDICYFLQENIKGSKPQMFAYSM